RPEQADERRDARRGRQERHAALELVHLVGGGADERAIDAVEALENRTRRTGWRSGGRPGRGRTRRRDAELRVHLGVTRLEDADERRGPDRWTHGLHLRELAAAAERVEETGRVAVRCAECPELLKDDRPRRDREDHQDEQERLVDRRGFRDNPDYIAAPGKRSLFNLHLQEEKGAKRAQRSLRYMGSAPWERRRHARVTRVRDPVKYMIRWKFRPHAPLPPHP